MHYAIILAGGSGQRLGSTTPKQFICIGGMPIIAWSMCTFQQMEEIDGIIITCAKEYQSFVKNICTEYSITKFCAFADSGKTRQLSSFNALCAYQYDDNDIVIIHDAARPFVSEEVVRKCILAAEQYGAAGTYLPVKDTIVEINNGFVHKNLRRENLRAAQTPQCFRYTLIHSAHLQAQEMQIFDATDDINLVLLIGGLAVAIEGDEQNIKITTPQDLTLAEMIAQKK